MRKEQIFKNKEAKRKGDTEKMNQIEKEMLKQMKAKSDEKSMKGKEDERKRATEKHKYQNGKFQKRDEHRE